MDDRVYIMDRNETYSTKSRDKIEPKFDARASDEHFSTEWTPTTAVYQVFNSTKGNCYTVAFYRTRSGADVLGSCNCEARLLCKHIVKAWKVQIEAENVGFITPV